MIHDFLYPKTDKWVPGSIKDKSKKIERLIQSECEQNHFNGCVLVLDDGNIIYKKAHGYAHYETGKLLDDTSVFYLASCSKSFTAMAIMMLEEKGTLEITDTVAKFIPEFPHKNITIEHLLAHTSGLPDYIDIMEKCWDRTKQASNNDIIHILARRKRKIHFAPGESFRYSNTGYVVLAEIVEKCSGMSFYDFMDKHIFQPLRMKSTYIGGASKKEGNKTPNWAYGHMYSRKLKKYVLQEDLPENKNIISLDGIVGDGGVNSTLNNLVIWDRALRENTLIKSVTMRRVYAKYRLKSGKESPYGYGWYVSGGGAFERVVWHSGTWYGYSAFILRFIDHDKTIIILSNNAYRSFKKLGDTIASILIGKE